LENTEFIRKLKLHNRLLEFYGANPFKTRAIDSAINILGSMEEQITALSITDLEEIDGLGKGIIQLIEEISESGTIAELEDNLSKTPKGIIELLNIKGLGPKKVKLIWDELGLTDVEGVLEAARSNRLSKLKGFGEKTQDKVRRTLEFKIANRGFYRYADIIHINNDIKQKISQCDRVDQMEEIGPLRRKEVIIDTLCYLVSVTDMRSFHNFITEVEELSINTKDSGPFAIRGVIHATDLKFEMLCTNPESFCNKLFLHTGTAQHYTVLEASGKKAYDLLQNEHFHSEKEIFEALDMQFIDPELREGYFEVDLAKEKAIPQLLEMKDLKGVLHNHSTYSDGKHSLREMAEYCKELGYEYVGMTDHSVSAFYANGLDIDRVKQQQEEIDSLNEELAPFRIFKGIESDILNDGRLDYPDDVLGSFDFIVASVHSNLEMDIKKATNRLLRAVENPYTTILGHMTGRLLLEREGYPIDHKLVIDACAKNGVVIEINANPWRLDIDWRWIHYALQQGVMLSINPDAHEKGGYQDMYFGVLAGRKGGLTKEMTLNCKTSKEISLFFENKGLFASKKD
jgi:DNA polymerase (family 10)